MSPAREDMLRHLNPAQKEAVLHRDGPILVLAGAGSGKTRVITHRIAYLIATGCPPDAVLAITFTNKAAGEMKERIEKLCGLRSPWVTTFHSFGARLLRKHAYRLEPYDTSFTICDADDSKAIVKEILSELSIDRELWDPRSALSEISRLKTASEGNAEILGADFRRGQQLRRIYERYRRLMEDRNLLDFDDLLLLLVRLFREHPDILERYRDQFLYVLVDEYQDTNALQYSICRLLAAKRGNICITGDPDQSIYQWRGADIRNILDFEADYPDARVVKLEQNYRSTKNVLHAANALIAHNTDRKHKELWTENEDGEPVRVYRHLDERTEARSVARLIREHVDAGVPLGDIGVFYRINALSRALEQELIYLNLPYQIVGGLEFYLRREIKDLLAYLHILDNPRNSESLRRIINVPPRRIGKATIEKLQGIARREGVGLLEVVLRPSLRESLAGAPSRALDEFAAIYRELEALKEGPVATLLDEIVKSSSYERYLEKSFDEEAQDRKDNIGELIGAAREYDETTPGEEASLRGFLELAAILGDVDRWERRDDRVSLMTLHSAKGLEFPVVMIIGVEEGILPLLRAVGETPDIEEERRLLYVGITRAKKKLYLTHTGSRMRYGRVDRSIPSTFLREILPAGEEAAVGFERLKMDLGSEESIFRPIAERGRRRRSTGSFPDSHGHEDGTFAEPEDDPFDQDFGDDGFESDEDPYALGTRLWHDDYGEGRVVRASGFGRYRNITVLFEEGVEKQFRVSHANLRRLQ